MSAVDAAATRRRPGPDTDEYWDRVLAASRSSEVRAFVAAMPPLTESQRTRLRSIIRGIGVDDG